MAMVRRLLLPVLIVFGLGSAVYLAQLRGDRDPSGKGETSDKDAAETAGREQAWVRELGNTPGRDALLSLRKKLAGKPRREAIAAIEEFLGRGSDRATGMELRVGRGGTIEGWPTLRVFLLDLLLEIDPGAAARISRGILAAESSADEWAIALRNVARGEGPGANRDYLRKRTEALIANPEWQARPSIGYLNAFDVLVYAKATETQPLLSGLVRRKDRPDLAHAAFLTLDRLVQREPVEMLTRLKGDRALQKSRPQMTAQQFARADLRDNSQRAIVRSWLLDPSRTSTELENFSAIYPNNNKLISDNLLTSEQQVPGADLQAHDREVLAVIRGWRGDPVFETRARYLEVMERRVSRFVKEAAGSSR
ncbi:MAG: hypothetical protein CMP28_13310 [Roseibacillus sp.]|nr:hypothetical protein [Roseibacillus sp.]